MPDQVTMIWTDATGTYEVSFAIENPSLADVKKAYNTNTIEPQAFIPEENSPEKNAMMSALAAPRAVSDEEFYTNLSHQLISDVLGYAQQHKQALLIKATPPIEIAAIPPPARRG